MALSLAQFHEQYDTEIFPVKVGNHELRFHKPKSIDRFIDPDNPMEGFPLWVKVWEASVVLMQYMADLEVIPERRIVELGSGLGVAGIAAAALGHDVTLTEYDSNALAFLQANAEVNHCSHLEIQRLDWFHPELEKRFDLIIGSEIVYQESAVKALRRLFKKLLAPGGKVILTERVRPTGAIFVEHLEHEFDVRPQKRSLRWKGKSETVILFEITLK